MTGYTKILNNLVNVIYRTAKPFTKHLDGGGVVDDETSRAMLASAESFKDNYLQFSAAAFKPQASEADRAAVDDTLTAIVLNVMYLLNKWAELTGQTPTPDTDEQLAFDEAVG